MPREVGIPKRAAKSDRGRSELRRLSAKHYRRRVNMR